MKTKLLLATSFALATLTSSAQWYAQASMTQARGQHGAVAHPNGNVYVWGGFINSNEFTSLEIYNQPSNTWSTGAPIPVATRGMVFALGQDSMIYSFGGYAGGYLNFAYRYNVSTNTWTSIASMPVANWESTAATGPDGRIYIFGGENSMNLLQIYDPVLNSWTTGTPLPFMSRMHSAITAPNGKIYVIGGWNGSNALSDNQVYDPVLNSWSTGAPLPNPRNQFGSTLSPDGKIYIIGGKNSGGNNSAPFYTFVDVYDPNTNTWTTDFSLSVGIGETEAVTVNGGINLIGGTSGTYLTSNYRLDLLCGTLTMSTTPSDTICIGQAIPLSASPNGGFPPYSYLWSTGATTSAINANPVVPTSYTVTVTDSLGCVLMSQVIVISIRPPVTASATAGNTTVCNGTPVVINAVANGGDGNYFYTWQPNIGSGAGPHTVSPTDTTTYTVMVADGCGSPTDTASVTIIVNPLPVLSLTAQLDTICANSNINILFGTPSGGTYFGTGVGGNNFNATVAGAGTHAVNYRYTNSNGCSDTITINIFVDLCTGVEEIDVMADGINIYPNPVINEFRIQNSKFKIEGIEIYDLVGQKISCWKFDAAKNKIDVHILPTGTYFVTIRTEKNNFMVRKFVKM